MAPVPRPARGITTDCAASPADGLAAPLGTAVRADLGRPRSGRGAIGRAAGGGGVGDHVRGWNRRLGLVIVLGLAGDALLELAHALPESLAQFRKALGPEDQEDHEQDDDGIDKGVAEHFSAPLSVVAEPRRTNITAYVHRASRRFKTP